MKTLLFIGPNVIRTSVDDKELNLIPGNPYKNEDLSTDYLKGLIAQGFFKEQEEPIKAPRQKRAGADTDKVGDDQTQP